MGYQPDIQPIYETLDIFAYPLNTKHFGSGEQTVIEAMYAGIPVVAFSNPTEKEIIDSNETGILVKNEEEYIKAIEYLYNNPEERVRMGRNVKGSYKKNVFNQKTAFRIWIKSTKSYC
jgi:glycosyltransferase involved in cell wall biosynthesis